VLATYRRRFQYILVDEFQDTNNLQYDIVSLLAGKHRNLFIVGDEDQSIYAFRGSNIDNIKKFMKEFPEHEKIVLNQNYRSKARILRAANDVISHNKKRIEKDLYSELGEGEKLIHFKGETDEEEVYYVYNQIKQYHRQGTPYGDMVILYRNNAMSRKFEDLFIKYHIPYKVIGNLSFYKRKEIKDIIAYLRLLLNTGDDYAFTRIHNEPKRGVGEVSYAKIRDEADRRNVKLMDVIEPDMDFLSSRATARLNELKDAITDIQEHLEEQNLIETYDEILKRSGYMAMLENDNHTEERKIQAERRKENLQEFKTILLERLRDYAGDVSNHEKLSDILNDLALREETEELTDDEDYVSLMTMHSAKGLEFDIVFVTCLEQTLFPSSQSLFEKADVEEERRLFYVALTRARERVILTNAQSRFMYGRYMHNPDSQFLGEIDDKHLERHGLAKRRKTKPIHQIKRKKKKRRKPVSVGYEPSKKHLKLGDKVNHTTFGEGVVVDLSGRKVTVAFNKETGIKTLLKDHPSIEKVTK
jgi:DNA helicase-2/ATP-dependent DNA helicase PcrA